MQLANRKTPPTGLNETQTKGFMRNWSLHVWCDPSGQSWSYHPGPPGWQTSGWHDNALSSPPAPSAHRKINKQTNKHWFTVLCNFNMSHQSHSVRTGFTFDSDAWSSSNTFSMVQLQEEAVDQRRSSFFVCFFLIYFILCVSYLASRYSRGNVSTSWWAIPEDMRSFSTSESTITRKYAHTQSSHDSHTASS